MLRPIFSRFVEVFDSEDKPDLDFWGKMCSYTRLGSGAPIVSGWITAFCVWDTDGRWRGSDSRASSSTRQDMHLELDGIRYPHIALNQIPYGFCEVDVLLVDNDEKVECMMVAGHVGATATASEGSAGLDTLQPSAHWFMFVKKPVARNEEDLGFYPPKQASNVRRTISSLVRRMSCTQ
jgi:hypothetical protein